MTEPKWGRLLDGDPEIMRQAYEAFLRQPVDLDLMDDNSEPLPERQTTLAKEVSATGPGTFLGRAQRTLVFAPTPDRGWWIDRRDIPDALPVRVAIENVWTTGAVVSNIVLRSGSPHNYLRMVEHIVALKVGLGLDQVVVRLDSGDPPLFDRGSMDLVDAITAAGIVPVDGLPTYVTVKESVAMVGPHGNFLVFHPARNGDRRLTVDCAIDFPNAIGKQRLKFVVNPRMMREGAVARTNTSLGKMIYCKTIGKLFADIRNLGYTDKNILIAGKRKYYNEPKLMHEGKSLEAVWHRSILDLLAAIALLEEGRFVGHIESYRAGHTLDCLAMRLLYKRGILVPFNVE